MQSFLAQWRSANIDEDARDKIIDEAGKHFGRQSQAMLGVLLRSSESPAVDEGGRSP